LCIALVLAEFGQHFGAASFGALLLGNGIVGAGEAGGQTVLARVCALAYTLDFPSMAAVEESVSLTGEAWGRRGCVGDSPIAGPLHGSSRGTGWARVGVGSHDGVASDWTRLSSSRGEEGNRRAGPVVLIVYLDMLWVRSGRILGSPLCHCAGKNAHCTW
jgi:hypothetical protein